MTRKFGACLCILFAMGGVLLFFHPLLFSGKTLFLRDIHRLFYPMKVFLASSLREGHLPFWCPHYFCGAPFLSDMQSGAFYPLSLLFTLLPPPGGFNAYVMLHFFLAFCFFYLWIRGLGLSRETGLLTAVSYSYGGYTIAVVNTLNNLSTLIWLPAILWSWNRTLSRRDKRGHLLTAFFIGMSILGGEPQLTILSLAILSMVAVVQLPAGHFQWAQGLKAAGILVLLGSAATLMALVQLAPAFQDYQYSARWGGIAYEEATRASVHWTELKHLILPLSFGHDFTTDPLFLKTSFPGQEGMPWLLTVYPGFTVLPLALLGLSGGPVRNRVAWFLLLLLSLVLALGHHTPVFRLFYALFPFFRYPAKFMCAAGFALLVLAAYGFEALIAFLRKRGLRPAYPFLLLTAILLLDLHSAHKGLNPVWESGFYRYTHPSLRPVLEDPARFRVFVDPDIPAAPSVPETIRNHHIRWQMVLMPNLGLLRGLDQVGGQTGLELRYQYFVTELLRMPWPQRIRFLRLANVKYIVTAQDLDKMPGTGEQVDRINGLVLRLRDNLPRAWVVGELKTVRRGGLEELVDPSWNPRTSALTRGEIVQRHTTPYTKEVEGITYAGNGRIHIEAALERPGVVVLSESSYPGWRVFVDGTEKDCLWLDLLFQGVEVGPGRHQIDFVYCPPYFKAALLISLSSCLLLVLVWGWLSLRAGKGEP